MDTEVNYQVVFTGRLRKGYEPAAVKQTLAQRLRLSPEKVERLFANGQTVLKQTSSQAQAKRIVMQLAAAGAIATITPGNSDAAVVAPPADKGAEKPADEKPLRAERPLPKFTPFRPMALFKPTLLAVAGIELLLGAVYAGLIAVLLGGVILPSLTTTWGGQLTGAPLAGLALQVALFLLATLTLLIVLKPLLALRASRHRGIIIGEAQEPDLHAFIADVCERIDAPPPSRIRLFNEATMRTAYHRGPLGFLRNEAVLTIGVPLIAGLNASQLAALVAQSLNRYRRPHLPRATAILLGANGWLQRAAYRDDPLEALVRRWHDEGRLGDGLHGVLQRFFAAGRALVRARLRLSQALGRHLIHRTVAEGDKAALAFAGTEGFVHMLEQSRLLAHAGDSVLPGLKAQWEAQGELPDNLVQLIVLHSRQYPVNMPQKLRAEQEQEKAAIGDILPSDNQRLTRVARQPVQGAYYCLSPAAVLFRNYAKLTRTMTLRFYHHRLQLPLNPYQLKPVTARGSLEQQLEQQLARSFRGLYADFLPLRLRQQVRELKDEEKARQQWQVATARIASEIERGRLARNQFEESERAHIDSALREEMQLAGLGARWDGQRLKGGELDAVHQQARDAEDEHAQAVKSLTQYLKAHAMRLAAALALLETAGTLPQAIRELRQEVHLLLSVLERIEHVHEQLRQLALHAILLESLLSYESLKGSQRLTDRTEQHAADCQHLVTAIGVALKSAPYPFANGNSRSMMEFVLQEATGEAGARGDFDRAHDTVKRLGLVQRRMLARLAAIGEQAEKALGLQQ
jgi:hypothetical protein